MTESPPCQMLHKAWTRALRPPRGFASRGRKVKLLSEGNQSGPKATDVSLDPGTLRNALLTSSHARQTLLGRGALQFRETASGSGARSRACCQTWGDKQGSCVSAGRVPSPMRGGEVGGGDLFLLARGCDAGCSLMVHGDALVAAVPAWCFAARSPSPRGSTSTQLAAPRCSSSPSPRGRQRNLSGKDLSRSSTKFEPCSAVCRTSAVNTVLPLLLRGCGLGSRGRRSARGWWLCLAAHPVPRASQPSQPRRLHTPRNPTAAFPGMLPAPGYPGNCSQMLSPMARGRARSSESPSPHLEPDVYGTRCPAGSPLQYAQQAAPGLGCWSQGGRRAVVVLINPN